MSHVGLHVRHSRLRPRHHSDASAAPDCVPAIVVCASAAPDCVPAVAVYASAAPDCVPAVAVYASAVPDRVYAVTVCLARRTLHAEQRRVSPRRGCFTVRREVCYRDDAAAQPVITKNSCRLAS